MSPQLYLLQPSLTLRILIWLVHLAALALLMLTVAPPYRASALLLLFSLWWQLRRVTLRELLVQRDLLTCLDSVNTRYQAKLLKSSWVGVYVIFLHLREISSQKKRTHVIAFDALSANDFRRLRMAIRLLVKCQ